MLYLFSRHGENFEVRKEDSPPTLISVVELARQQTSSGVMRQTIMQLCQSGGFLTRALTWEGDFPILQNKGDNAVVAVLFCLLIWSLISVI